MNLRASENENHGAITSAVGCIDIQEKCTRLTKTIDSAGTHSLNNIFQGIMEDIFFSKVFSWGLTRNNHSPSDSAYIKMFLGRNGALFRLIERMQNNCVQTKCPISTSSVPNLSGLHVNESYKFSGAFEAYFSYFAQFIIKSFQNRPSEFFPAVLSHSSSGLEECLYFVLLDDYLSDYFPTEGDALPPTLNMGKQGNSYKLPTKAAYNMTKASMLLRHDSTFHTSPGQFSHNEPRCCDILVQIFTEFWLDDYQSSSSATDSSKAPTQKVAPNDNHVRAIRLLIKHVHSATQRTDHSLIKRFGNDSILEQINQGIMSKMQPKLLCFLEFCFNTWPLDRNFRIVLETWLSYIQPWRYCKGQISAQENSLQPECTISNKWYHFVNCNLQFYTKLFKLVIKRFIRMDISSAINAILLYRVAKIYGQQNMINLIEQAEETVVINSFQASQNYESYIGSPVQSRSFETAEEASIFSPGFTNVMKQLLLIITQALESIKSSSDSKNRDWVNNAVNFFGYGALNANPSSRSTDPSMDRRKTAQNLTSALDTFAKIYDLPKPTPSRVFAHTSENDDIADHVIDENGRKVLTPTGRSQMMNNMKRFAVEPNVPSALRPICSYENAFLVRTFYHLSCRFNKKYEEDLEEICNRGDFFGKFCTQLFLHSPNEKPYLSLRFMAHYRNLFYLGFLFFLSCLFGFSFTTALLYLVAFTFIYVAVKAFFGH